MCAMVRSRTGNIPVIATQMTHRTYNSPIGTRFDATRLDTPTFHRNHRPIVDVIRGHIAVDVEGHAIEVGSGSGQHVVGFARAFPNLIWHPSDPDPRHRASIDGWRVSSGLEANITDALDLDASQPNWNDIPATCAAIVSINVLHIAPWEVTTGLLAGAGRHLADMAALFIYGPFKRDGAHTAESNVAFDQSLRARNPDWGIRDIVDLVDVAQDHGLQLADTAPMPANNFTLVFRRHM